MLLLALVFALVFPQPLAQEKPSVSFDAILGCVSAQSCRNMTASRTNWYDVVDIPVMVFSADGTTYELSASRGTMKGTLRIHVTLPGERAASRAFTVGADDQVVSGELGPQPGDKPAPAQLTKEELALSFQTHKVYSAVSQIPSPPSRGDEFKAFWQEQVTAAMAAIRRQISK